MKNTIIYQVVSGSLLLLLLSGFVPVRAPEVAGSWLMVAHKVSPAQDGITDLYGYFKDLYGGCQKDMGVVLNVDKTVTITPAGGCQNPLGNMLMKVVTKFMPSGNVSWEVNGDKISLQDKKGQRRENTLQQSGTEMQWLFDETSKQTTVHHIIEYRRN